MMIKMEMGAAYYLEDKYKKLILKIKLMVPTYNSKIQNFLCQSRQFYFQMNKKELKKMDIRKRPAFY